MTAQKPSVCPLRIATTATARGLIRLYARLLGELDKSAKGRECLVEPKVAQEMMQHCEDLLCFMGIQFDRSSVKVVRTEPKVGPLDYGEIRSGILSALRSGADWMAYPEIAERILARHHITLRDTKQRKHFLQKVREATYILYGEGAVERQKELKLGDTTETQRWRLSRTLFRRK